MNTKWILSLAGLLGAVGTIYTFGDDVFYFQAEANAHIEEYQQDKCVSIGRRLNDAYALRDQYGFRGEPVPQWLSQQIAEFEQYIRAYC